MTTWADRIRKAKHSPRRRFHRRKRGCAICGEEIFKHTPNSYYGHIEHGYKRG